MVIKKWNSKIKLAVCCISTSLISVLSCVSLSLSLCTVLCSSRITFVSMYVRVNHDMLIMMKWGMFCIFIYSFEIIFKFTTLVWILNYWEMYVQGNKKGKKLITIHAFNFRMHVIRKNKTYHFLFNLFHRSNIPIRMQLFYFFNPLKQCIDIILCAWRLHVQNSTSLSEFVFLGLGCLGNPLKNQFNPITTSMWS